MTVLWLNGTFGVGKTTTARRLRDALPGSRLFDPEAVGQLLAAHLPDVVVDDFTEHEAWPHLVAETAVALAAHTPGELVAVQTVLDRARWGRVRTALAGRGLAVHHVVLDVDPDVLRARIDASDDAHDWRHQHVPAWVAARDWLRAGADTVVDTSGRDVDAVVEAVLAGIRRA